MTNWNHDTRMNSPGTGVSPIHAIGTSQSKRLLADNGSITKSSELSNRSFSILGIGIFSNILQRLTNIFTNMLPTIAQMNKLERSKQPISSSDIFVDININTPIFETDNGKALLMVPDGGTCNKKKSISDRNSLFNWCPIKEKADKISSYDYQQFEMYKKRVRVVCNQTSARISEDSSILWTFDRSINANKSKGCDKNRQEKVRYNLVHNIMEDYQLIFEENGFESETGNNNPSQSIEYESRNGFGSIPILAENISVLDLSEESFPICSPIADNTNCEVLDDGRNSRQSESDSENSFVIFSENLQSTTPSASPYMRRDLYTTINNFFTPPERPQRQRQLSECSDDSIVFCYENDQDEHDCPNVTDLDSGDDSDTERDEHNCKQNSKGTRSYQPDSGFEERKVQFNLTPEVHVMRTWDFAYRQARKGDWEMAARDRERFKKRILKTEDVLSIVFDKNVRDRVYQERFNKEFVK